MLKSQFPVLIHLGAEMPGRMAILRHFGIAFKSKIITTQDETCRVAESRF